MSAKHSPELLDSIWQQRRNAYMKHFKPKLRIWLNRYDLQILVMETRLISRGTDVTAVLSGKQSVRLFGEETFVAPDTIEGEPIVEVVMGEKSES